MDRIQRILVCPLNWGLGHASRCIPVINCLIAGGYDVVIAADKEPYHLLKAEFPDLTFARFPGYEVRYSKRFVSLAIGLQVPRILFGIFKEHRLLKDLIETHKIDLVISDNRFGCWNRSIPSVIISHQIFIQAPLWQSLIRSMNFWFLGKYRQIWIPDNAGEQNLSGNLAHESSPPKQAKYIGPLSRFENVKSTESEPIRFDLCVVLSGPEPQRSILEALLIKQIKQVKLKVILLRGLVSAENKQNHFPATMEVINHTDSRNFRRIIQQSELVLARSGYSTIMDLAVLGKKAIFIPTPGQPEQEYLGALLKERKRCYCVNQADFDLTIALEKSKDYCGFSSKEVFTLQKEKLLKLIEDLNLPTKK